MKLHGECGAAVRAPALENIVYRISGAVWNSL